VLHGTAYFFFFGGGGEETYGQYIHGLARKIHGSNNVDMTSNWLGQKLQQREQKIVRNVTAIQYSTVAAVDYIRIVLYNKIVLITSNLSS
jgi:hypothetical protein